jgi:hypothetical protein
MPNYQLYHENGFRVEEKETVTKAPKLDNDVILPATLVAVAFLIGTANLVWLAGAVAGRYYGLELPSGLLIPVSISAGLLLGSIAYVWMQISLYGLYLDRLTQFQRTETPLEQAPPANIYVTAERITSKLPAEPRPGALAGLVQVLASGKPLTERLAAEYGYSGKLWDELRDATVGQGWYVWRNPNNTQLGLDPTSRGLAVWAALSRELDPPTPSGDGR